MPPARVLVVANRTAATPRLLDTVRKRAKQSDCEFSLLIPPGRDDDWDADTAAGLLRRAAHRPLAAMDAGEDACAAIERAVAAGEVDEIIVSTKPPRGSRLLRRDLVHRVERLGVPVTTVVPTVRKLTKEEKLEDIGRFNAGGGF